MLVVAWRRIQPKEISFANKNFSNFHKCFFPPVDATNVTSVRLSWTWRFNRSNTYNESICSKTFRYGFSVKWFKRHVAPASISSYLTRILMCCKENLPTWVSTKTICVFTSTVENISVTTIHHSWQNRASLWLFHCKYSISWCELW